MILEHIENFMETYKRQASENIIDHTRGIDQFQVDDVNDFE